MNSTCARWVVMYTVLLLTWCPDGPAQSLEEDECGTRKVWRNLSEKAHTAWARGSLAEAVWLQREAIGYAASSFGTDKGKYFLEVEQLATFLGGIGGYREAIGLIEKVAAFWKDRGPSQRAQLMRIQKRLDQFRALAPLAPAALDLESGKVKEIKRVGTEFKLRGISFQGEKSLLIHTHGGDRAHLASAALQISNSGSSRAATLKIDRAWLVRAHCMHPKEWHQAFALKLTRSTRDGKDIPPGKPIVLGPGSTRLWIAFEPREVYQACDHFAVRFGLLLDNQAFELEAEVDVEREEPLPDDIY